MEGGSSGFEVGGGIIIALFNFLLKLINMAFILLHEWQQEVIVDSQGSNTGGVEHPDEERYLHNIVEGDEGEDDACELVCNSECSEYYPIRQPLFIIVCPI